MRKAPSVQITTTWRRTAASVLAAAIAVVVPASTALGATSLRAQTGAGVLQRYLAANGNHFHTTFDGQDFADYGLTLDGVIAMDAAGVGDYRSEQVTEYVSEHLSEYAGDGDTESYAGATAKALLVSLSQNITPKGTLGNADLVTRLKALENQTTGRFSDRSQFGDFSNNIGQSLALVSLHKAGQTLSYNSIAYLRQQQCTSGGFRLNPGTTACVGDPDTTSFAVQGLLAAPQTSVTKSRIAKAITFLKSKMAANGGVRGGTTTEAPNSNSTGLAVLAFDSTGNATLANKGRTFLVALRYGCAFPASMRGAIAYNASAKSAQAAKGSSATLTDQDLRTTTQAVLGFTQKPLKDLTNTGASFSSPTVSC
jgi:hypothetical protein